MKVSEENRDAIDNIVNNKEINFVLKRNAESLLKRLEPIVIALYLVQEKYLHYYLSCTYSEKFRNET